MNKYQVRTRYTGSILIEVKAENEDQAQGLADKMIQSMDSDTFLEALEPQKLDTEITLLKRLKNGN